MQGLYAGLTLSEAVGHAGLPVQTVKNWLTRGRSEIGTEYAGFAVAVDAARDAAARAVMSDAEFQGALNRAVRAGSVSAMKLWWQLRAAGDSFEAFGGPFAVLDGPSCLDQLDGHYDEREDNNDHDSQPKGSYE